HHYLRIDPPQPTVCLPDAGCSLACCSCPPFCLRPACCFFFTDPAPTEIYTLSLHDALPTSAKHWRSSPTTCPATTSRSSPARGRSEEHTSELQSRENLVCRLLLEKKKNQATEGIAEANNLSGLSILLSHLQHIQLATGARRA